MTRPGSRSIIPAAFTASLLVSSCVSGPGDPLTERSPEAREEVERAIRDLLGALESKDIPRLESFHLYGPNFSRFDGKTPGRMDADATRRAEREGIEAVEEFRATVEDLKVDVFGAAAVSTFVMPYEVVAAGRTVPATTRATLVWVRTRDGWRIAHEHLSPVPAEP